MSLFSVTLLLSAAGLCAAQCDQGVLVGYPGPGQLIYIAPGDPCTLAETVSEIGNCATYTDQASLVGPLGGAVTSTYSVTGTQSTASITNVYGGATSLAEGSYSLYDYVTMDILTQTWLAEITITTEPAYITTASTKTVFDVVTTYATSTETCTTTITTDIVGDCTKTVTIDETYTHTACPVIVHSTKTITPKETKTVYSTDVVKITPSCLPCVFPPPVSPCQRHIGSHDKRGNRLPYGVVPLVEREVEKREDMRAQAIEKRGAPSVCSLQGQPTATLYTTTILITSTSTVTCGTDTVTTTNVVTITDTVKGTTTVGSVTCVTVTPTETVWCTTHAPRETYTTTDMITITCNAKGPHITHCGAPPHPPPAPPSPPGHKEPCITSTTSTEKTKPTKEPCTESQPEKEPDTESKPMKKPCTEEAQPSETPCDHKKPKPVVTVVPCESGWTTSSWYPPATEEATATSQPGTVPLWTSMGARVQVAVAGFIGVLGAVFMLL